MTSSPESNGPSLRAWLILLAVLLMVFAINLDYTAVNLSLVSISHDIAANINTLQWLLSGYALAWGASIVPAGRLADIFGKRRMLLWGIGIFALSSAFIGLGQNTAMLIGGRILQGVGGAFFIPPLYAITFGTFEGKQQGFAMGLVGAAAGIGLAIGPTFGGVILEHLSWRWIFFINVPLCALTFYIISTLIEREPKRLLDESLDRVGTVLLGTAMATLIYSLNELTNNHISGLSLFLLALGLTSLVCLVLWQRRSSNPLIPLHLLKNEAYLKGTIMPFFTHQFTFSMVLVTMGFYLQNVRGLSAYEAGILFLSLTAGFGVLSIFGGKLTDTMGLRFPSYAGLLVIALGTLSLATLGAQSSLSHVAVGLALTGIGLGLCFSSFNTAMMKTVEPSEITVASGFFGMNCLIGHTTAIIIASSMISTIGSYYMQWTFSYPIEIMDQLCTIMSCPHRDPALFAGLPQGFEVVLDEAFLFAMRISMGLCTVLTLWGAFMSFRYLHLPAEKNEAPSSHGGHALI